MTLVRILVGALTAATVMQGAVLKASAQENVDAFSCQYIEAPTAEPFGNEEGHGISVRDYACQVTQGPLSGGVLTARAVWEMDNPAAGSFWAAASFASRARWLSFNSPRENWSI